MKIAILNKYQDKVFRGAEKYIAELAKRLSKNHQVDIISNINYFNLLKKKYDIIIPTNGRLQAFIVRKITWLTHSKMIISGQSGPGLDDRLNLYSFPNTFIGLTKFQSTWAKKINPFVKVVTIPNGVDLTEFQKKNDTKSSKQKIVLAVGAFTKEKGHEYTINAVSKLENVKLIIAGGGGNLKDKIQKLGLEKLGKDRFEVVSVPFEKMPQLYRNADLFVFPTVPWESFGIVLLEAMATGLPVVATDDPIRREIVGDAGLFVNPKNIQAYSSAINKALETDWKDKPRKQAEKFSWDNIANKYEELIKKIAD